MATAAKIKPAPAQTATEAKPPADRNSADNACVSLSAFEQALSAARDLLLGPPDGEPGKIGELENETWSCERSTAEAILGAQPTEKLSAFYRGFDELREKLCASAARYYNTCFKLALNNRTEFDAALAIIAAELDSMAKTGNPAEFARGFTTGDLSAFLRVTALDGKEVASNGRVREFVGHACGDYFDVLPSLVPRLNTTFRMPRWPRGRSLGARLAQWPITRTNGDESTTLSVEETEEFILGAEEALLKDLRCAVADAHRIALVTLGKSGNATTVPSQAAPGSAERPGMPEYRSEIKNAVFGRLSQDNDASDRQLCNWFDAEGNVELPPNWAKHGNRSFAAAYADSKIKPKMESRFSEVRRDMRAAGYHIP